MDFLHSHLKRFSPASDRASGKPARLVFELNIVEEMQEWGKVEKDKETITNKMKEYAQTKTPDLQRKIDDLAKKGENATEVKNNLKLETEKIAEDALNHVMHELGIKLTYEDWKKSQYKEAQVAINTIKSEINTIIDKAVDDYFAQKAAASQQAGQAISQGLTAGGAPSTTPATPSAPSTAPQSPSTVPGQVPSAPTSSSSTPAETIVPSPEPNPETSRLLAVVQERNKAKNEGVTNRAQLRQELPSPYTTRTSSIDRLTSPDNGIIDNYETTYKFWSDEVTNAKNPTRHRLQGYLYAHDIFAGGGSAGDQAVREAIKEPQKVFESKWKNKLEMADLENLVGADYFKRASEYSSSDRVIGTIAGLFALVDKNLGDKPQHEIYKNHLEEKLQELKRSGSNEETQLKILFSLQSFSETLHLDNNWRSSLAQIDHLTDPDAPGAKIDDYPGWGSDNKNNKTRQNLNGYLYATQLIYGDAKMQDEFKRAVGMFENSGLVNKDFTQEMLDNTAAENAMPLSARNIEPVLGHPEALYKLARGKQDGFGLASYLQESGKYTKDEQVAGTIAGILKAVQDQKAQHPGYEAYVTQKLETLKPEDSPDLQMSILATIKRPAEAAQDAQKEAYDLMMSQLIAATRQHPKFTLSTELNTVLRAKGSDPAAISPKALDEMKNFVNTRTAKNPAAALQPKYQELVKANKALQQPLYSDEDFQALSKSLTDINGEFSQAREIGKATSLGEAVNKEYLVSLKKAEDGLEQQLKNLQSMLQAVAERRAQQNKPAEGPKPVPTPPPAPEKPATPPKTPDAPTELPILSNTTHLGPIALDIVFQDVINQVENGPGIAYFNIPYTGLAINCRVQKYANGTRHLFFESTHAGSGELVFNNVPEIHHYLESGLFYQQLAKNSLLNRRNWDYHKAGLGELQDLQSKGPWGVSLELDWHGGGVLSSGNAEVELNVGPDGLIHYLIKAPNVGPDGEDQRSGSVSDFTQLTSTLWHCKQWSEQYTKNYQQENFKEMLVHERLLRSLMGASTFEQAAPLIGEKYFFNHFDAYGYGYMFLNWDNAPTLTERNRAINNPILQYRLNPDNTISWVLTRRTGPNSTLVGTQGRANHLEDLFNQVAAIRGKAITSMVTPAEQLANIGDFGRSLA